MASPRAKRPHSPGESAPARLGWAGVRAGVVGYAAFVAYMSLKPFRDVPLDLAIDRIGRAYLHLPAYALLGALVFVVWPEQGRRWRRALFASLAAAGYGWALEVAQIPAPTRSFNLTGLVFDALGAALSAAAALGFAAWRSRNRRSG